MEFRSVVAAVAWGKAPCKPVVPLGATTVKKQHTEDLTCHIHAGLQSRHEYPF